MYGGGSSLVRLFGVPSVACSDIYSVCNVTLRQHWFLGGLFRDLVVERKMVCVCADVACLDIALTGCLVKVWHVFHALSP